MHIRLSNIFASTIALFLIASSFAFGAITFSNIGAPLTGVRNFSQAWGDYDDDGDLDLAVAGEITAAGSIAKIYRNDSGSFVDIGASIAGASYGAVAWADYDNDGDLDLAVVGNYAAKIYQNNNGTFTDLRINTITGVTYGAVAWGDYDNDGHPDLAIAGQDYGGVYRALIYHNDGGGKFTDIKAQLTGVSWAYLAWADYDNDGDLDIIISGTDRTNNKGRLYRNDNGKFVNVNADLPVLTSPCWGDCDNDGDLDLAFGTTPNVKIYKNDQGVLTDSGTTISGYQPKWGDYDNDGDLDLAISGGKSTNIFTNNGNFSFSDSGISVAGINATWGDYDNDGDLDMATGGDIGTSSVVFSSQIFRNDGAPANKAPSALTSVSASITNKGLEIRWNAGSDTETPSAGLSYNISVGTQPDTANIVSSMAKFNTGLRLLPETGNSQQTLSKTLIGLPPVTYYYKVQAIDSAFAGSQWSTQCQIDPVSISGHVKTAFGEGVYGVTVSADNYGGSATTDDSGVYTLKVLPGWSGKLTATKLGRTFEPASLTLTDVKDDTSGQDFAALYWFADTGSTLIGVKNGAVAWGDYDNDGDFDLVVTGDDGSNPTSKIYKNNSGTLVDSGAQIIGVKSSSVAWGDYDGDGDLDLAIAGDTTNGPITKIYQNGGDEGFVDSNITLTGVKDCSIAWADFDNDGDLDLATAGSTESGRITRIYRNNAGSFVDSGVSLVGLSFASIAWADYDNDGDMDLAISGSDGTTDVIKLMKNDGGIFTSVSSSIYGISHGSICWGDYDNDGYLDLAASGMMGTIRSGTVYKNSGSILGNSIGQVFPISDSSVTWVDYDNDGDTDLVYAGNSDYGPIAYAYHNNNGSLTSTDIGINYVTNAAIAWADYDNDGALDLVVTGNTSSGPTTRLYHNRLVNTNTSPAAPTNLTVAVTNTSGVSFSWKASSDAQTPANGLTYNLRIGTQPGQNDIFAGMADTSTGTRRIPTLGNVQRSLKWICKDLPAGNYYWSVQAVDSAFVGGSWSAEQTVGFASISGYIKSPDGTGISGVTVTPDNGGVVRTTGTNGFYRLELPSGWSGKVVISKPGYVFNPESNIYSNVTTDIEGQNYTGRISFADSQISLPTLQNACIAWGDYDNDGDLDIAAIGGQGSTPVAKIFRNDGGTFTDSNISLLGVQYGSVAWGDYDNDGWLDLAISGNKSSGKATKVYRNNKGVFEDVSSGLPVAGGRLEWGDFNNDGKLDLAFSGHTGTAPITKIYRNDGNAFTDINAGLTNVSGAITWGDYDNDGDLDLLVSGTIDTYNYSTAIYRNDNGEFTDIAAGLPNLGNAKAAWVDYDNDGDLDISLCGNPYSTSSYISKIFRNDRGYFVDSGISLSQVSGQFTWGDYDNDGDMDLAFSTSGSTIVYRNDDGKFTDINAGISANGLAAWGDYDNDGALDLAICGGYYPTSFKILRNYSEKKNTAPTVPTDLTSAPTNGGITFSWSPATDIQSIDKALSYNIRIGTTPGGSDIYSGMANLSGVRKIPTLGNAQKNLSWTLKCASSRTYYWSVQTIDTAYAASDWAPEATTENFVTISGSVKSGNGTPISGVIIQTENRNWATTDLNGNYVLDLPLGWSGNVSAKKYGWNLTPSVRNYEPISQNVDGENYIGTAWFTKTDIGIAGLTCSYLDWGDYDGDGDMDVVVSGNSTSGDFTRIYNNDHGVFTSINAQLMGCNRCAAIWGDYDNDGDLDLLVAGYNGNGTRIYRNDNGSFVDINAGLPNAGEGASADWGDFDNDGDLDIALAGDYVVKGIFRNDGGKFINIGANIPKARYGAVKWGDYDNDGDLDLLMTGTDVGTGDFTKILRNDNGIFTDIKAGLVPASFSTAAWGDYDNDGDLDLVISGKGTYTKIYRNDAGKFTDIRAELLNVSWSSVSWGDYDNDGDLDLAVSGSGPVGQLSYTRIFKNDRGAFKAIDAGLTSISAGRLQWVDYDNDGDLDLTVIGGEGTNPVVAVYVNNCGTINTPPNPPTGLSAHYTTDTVQFSWDAATDAETPATGLSYNIRVGTTPGAGDLFSGMANPSTGLRYVPATGNAQKNLIWTLKRTTPGICYWSVQTIDTAYAGSQWASEQVYIPEVSGRARTAKGEPIPGAKIALDNGIWTTTDANGFYKLAVSVGWSGTATVSKDLYTFQPSSIPYENVTSDKKDQDYVSVNGFGAVVTELAGVKPAWGDYDNDGDLDLAISGRIMRNDAGRFVDTGITTDSYNPAWGDMDGDGDLDLAVGPSIYNNNAGSFKQIQITYSGVPSWGDYDNDGDLDFVIGCAIMPNTGSTLSELYAFADGIIKLGDYDNDGDLDAASPNSIYRNDNGVYTNIKAVMQKLDEGLPAWGDYDNDGDLDLAVSSSYICNVYKNDNGVFTQINVATALNQVGYPAWGDLDNDGDLDLAAGGKIFRNNNGAFEDLGINLNGSTPAWGDFDGDGDLDLALDRSIYENGAYKSSISIYRNDIDVINTPPTAPAGLQAVNDNDGITFSWEAATDAQTPSAGLSYNLRVGTAPGKDDLFSGMSSSTGIRLLPGLGNAQKRLSWHLKVSVPGSYYWSVQAIDSAFAGSAWADGDQAINFAKITGYIRTSKGYPIYDAVVSLNNGISTISDANGYYRLPATDGLSYTITVSKPLYSFDPPSRTCIMAGDISGQDFVASGGISYSYIALPGKKPSWGDYDADGDLDLAITDTDITKPAKIFRNDGGVFTDIKAPLTSETSNFLAWEDYDKDGDLDLAFASGIYRNNNGLFAKVATFTSTNDSTVDWGDYDHDGDQDLLAGAYVYQNTGTGFSKVFQPGYNLASWFDYDSDGDFDIAGLKYFSNNGGTFTQDSVQCGAAIWKNGPRIWGDYDNDGDLDGIGWTDVQRNNGDKTFTAVGSIPGDIFAWGDMDNDGDLDIVSVAKINYKPQVRIYFNEDGKFTPFDLERGPDGDPTVAVGDYDNDGDLDFIVSGWAEGCRIYRNDCIRPNQLPTAPKSLFTSTALDSVTFSWNASTDPETPSLGLSYNIRVGTTPGGEDIVSCAADCLTGYRRIPEIGNAIQETSWKLNQWLPIGTYYWSVQAIDTNFAGSAWSRPCKFIIGNTYIGNYKKQANGSKIDCPRAVVTAAFNECFYIESDDRSSGIKVAMPGYSVAVGIRLYITGTLKTNANGEKYIEPTDVYADPSRGTIAPLTLSNKALGGSAWNYDSVIGTGQRGVENGIGLNTIGLLVKTTGLVTHTEGSYIYIDDGSQVDDFGTYKGITVYCGTLAQPMVGQYVAITGISTITKIGDKCYRCIRPRTNADIQRLK